MRPLSAGIIVRLLDWTRFCKCCKPFQLRRCITLPICAKIASLQRGISIYLVFGPFFASPRTIWWPLPFVSETTFH
jgi:hypothetical protein